jgi:hypothetical protein
MHALAGELLATSAVGSAPSYLMTPILLPRCEVSCAHILLKSSLYIGELLRIGFN